MPNPTPELGLQQAVDSDDTADYLDTALANSLVTIDSLFNNTSGHTHGGVHQGGPINTIPPSAIPDGAITSIKIADGSIATIDLADGCITPPKLAAGAVTTPAIAASTTLTTPILNSATLNSPLMSNVTITNLSIGGTISGGEWQYGPSTVDWFRCDTLGQGLYNNIAGIGVGIDATGPFVYGGYGGGHIITEQAAQTLSNKTINSATLNSGSCNAMYLSNCAFQNHVGGAPIWDSAQNFPNGTRVGPALALANVDPNSPNYRIDSGAGFANAAPTGAVSQYPINFAAAFAVAPTVLATLREPSGGPNVVPNMHIEVRAIGTTGFMAMVSNNTGSTQSVSIDWIAFGY